MTFTAMPSSASSTKDCPWWKGAAIYQIYPRSFMDSNGDGVGDLPGITRRLEYVASLGVDAVWISPFFPSPMRDFGYDVSDYCDVDPIFGTLQDFDELLARAHDLGLKVLIDQVYAHTSDEHAWFRESRNDRRNPKSDWYVWSDPKPDGTPPSNWQSVFGGAAWTWDARRGQYFMHNFLSCQPQLNLRNREVQDAVLDAMRFWLQRGVDGFRLDALNFAMHDPQLRDNPPAGPQDTPFSRPFDFQQKLYNQSHPDIPKFIERVRALTDSFGGAFTLAEVPGAKAEGEMKAFTEGKTHLNSAYGFNFLYADQLTPQLVCSALAQWPDEPGSGWPSFAFENHDAPRAASRWWDEEERPAATRLKMLVLMALRGNVILYQGEELGLEQVHLEFDQLRDPEAIANWPLTLSRDGARAPIPWKKDAADRGFGSQEPWLPFGLNNVLRAVDVQEHDLSSTLHHTRSMLALRQSHPALRHGRVTRCEGNGAVLLLDRRSDEEELRIIANLGSQVVELDPTAAQGLILFALNGASAVTLPPFAALVLSMQGEERSADASKS